MLKLVQYIARSPGSRDAYGLFLTTERKQNNKKICLPCFGVPNVHQEFRPALIAFCATAKIHQTSEKEADPTARQIKQGRVKRRAAPLTFPKRQAVQSVPTTTGRRRKANMLNAKRSNSTTARLQARAWSTIVSGAVRDRMPPVSGIYTLRMTSKKMHNWLKWNLIHWKYAGGYFDELRRKGLFLVWQWTSGSPLLLAVPFLDGEQNKERAVVLIQKSPETMIFNTQLWSNRYSGVWFSLCVAGNATWRSATNGWTWKLFSTRIFER